MFSKSAKRLSVFLSAVVISISLTGITAKKAEALLPKYILVPLTIQATGYALPRVYQRLTPQQQRQVNALQNQAFRQIANVLTTAQRSEIMQSLKTPQGRRKLFRAMRLNNSQKRQIRVIVNRYRQRLNRIVGN